MSILKKKKGYITGFIGMIVVSVLIIGFTITMWAKLNKKVSDDSINSLGKFYLQEMSERNLSAITNILDQRQSQMEMAVSYMETYPMTSEESVKNFISVVQKINMLNIFALVDEEGSIYTKDGIFSKLPEFSFLTEPITENKILILSGNDFNPLVMILYPVENKKKFKNHTFTACFAGIEANKMVSSELMQTSNSQSFSELYENNGFSIVETSINPLNGRNLFDYYYSEVIFAKGYSVEKMKSDWAEGKEGYSVYNSKQFGKTYLYYKPVANTNWMMTTFMRESDINIAVEKTSRKMAIFSLILLVITVLLILDIYIFIYHLIRKEYNSHLETEMERKANKAKTTFLFNMSHDIRTPMNAIIGFANLAEKHINDKILSLNYIHKIQSASDVLLSLINNILEIARIESGNEKLNEEEWNLRNLDDTISSIFDSTMAEKKIIFIKEVNITHRDIICDSSKVRAILLNLLSNAYKYTNKGGKVVMKVTEIPSEKEGYASYKTVITDTGIGMSEDFIPHIFEEFSRERTSTESRIIGSGLGMQIVKKYIDLMGGSIHIDSELGKGTVITMILTHKIIQKDIYNNDNAVQKIDKYSCFKKKRVLLAEDNDLNAEIAVSILQELGLKVERAPDGEVCVRMLQEAVENYYDFILMDIQMPNMDGYDAARKIRTMDNKIKADIPIVAMTANAFEEDRKTAFDSGMNGHIAKPIDLDNLVKTLRNILE